MASPFAIFRKNQKVMMVGLTVLAMVAFVLSDAFDMRGKFGGGGGSDADVVATKFFTMSESEVRQAMSDRQLVLQFVENSLALAIQQRQLAEMRQQLPQISPEQFDAMMGGSIARMQAQAQAQASAYAENRFGPVSETSVVDTATLAAEAKRLGVVASDTMVETFIYETALQRMVPSDQMNAVFKSVSGGRVTYRQFLGAFRNEMLSWMMQSLIAGNALQTATPIDRWDYYLRKRCLATAEVMPVRTKEDIIDKKLVPEPTDAQLAAFFEEHRFDEPVPGSPDPGFKVPQKAKFQYAAADEASFLEPDKITAEQVAAHYETNKTRYPYTPEDFNAPKKPDDATAPKSSTDEKKEPTKVAPDCGLTDDASDESSCDAAADEKPAETKPAETKPAETKPAEKKEDDKKTPETKTPETSPASATPAAAKPAATPTATPSAVPAASPTASAAAPPAPAALPPAPLPIEDLLLPSDVATGRNPQYEPLWKVEEKIREELAKRAASDKAKELLEKLRSEMSLATLNRNPKSDKPLFDDKQWEELLAKYPGLVGQTTPLMTDVEAREAAENPGFFRATTNGERVAFAGYSESAVYVAKDAIEVPDASLTETRESVTRYVFWKILNEPAYVPDLTDLKTREQVKFAWQTQQARAKARELADKYAKDARQSPKPLAEQFPERDVKQTNLFAWYETDLSGGFNSQPRPTRLSRVDGVDDAGPEFMQTVFGLDVDQVGTAMNNPETICYVIRVKSQTPARSQLYDAFMVENFQTYRQYSQEETMRNGGNAIRALLAEADIRWLREPHEARDRNR